eukprot:TRINITY_DN11534_c0_g1_i1.p1 TRINITY_DN11534_c0_g1~~TRINITY_DN11534_c0_g1_i1.p1  ORF type:complete len:136 (-),score=29.24 TRINITY_DN11534_c0_g1_i1:139-546(-)
MSIADSNAEIVRSSYGFYGLPNYRPYGFTYGGSSGINAEYMGQSAGDHCSNKTLQLAMGTFAGILILVMTIFLDPTNSMSIADSNAEIIRSSYGFYGLPNYRPYGFTYGGYGSSGYGYMSTYIDSPNIYGGTLPI